MDRSRWITLIAAGAALVGLVALAPARTDDALRLEGTVIAGGGAMLEGGTFRVNGTVGQPATHVLTGASLRLYDGFWSPAASASDVIFSNGFDP